MVSILTPTYNRRPFIPQYLKYVRHQDYKGRIEVLVADDGEDSVADLFQRDITIRYIRLDKRMPLGYKRNLLASEAKGEILVHMDDDDYYPPSRVSHAVSKLISSEKIIAGASQCFFYDLLESKVTVSGPFGDNHGTCGTFAYFNKR
jgi:glycosyltransferase involved in cell wall biosynthesis